jgi:hypothetical protein
MGLSAAARWKARERRRGAAVALLLAAAVAAPAGQAPQPLETALAPAAIAEAVRVGLSRESPAVDLFHDQYRRLLGGPFLQSVELITEFRRVVLTAERARRAGEAWDVRSAERALEPFRGLVTVVVQVRFNPQNTYRTTPRLEALIYPRSGGTVPPLDQRFRPSYRSGPAPAGTPVLEGTLEAEFLASSLDPGGPLLVGVFLEGREIERIPVDLSTIR